MSVAYNSKVLSFPLDHFCHLFFIPDPLVLIEMTKALEMVESESGKNSLVFSKMKFNPEKQVKWKRG